MGQNPQKIFQFFRFSFTNSATVSLCTPKILAIADFETFLSSKVFICASFPVNFSTFDLLHFRRPSITPSAHLRARASFVCCEIRLWFLEIKIKIGCCILEFFFHFHPNENTNFLIFNMIFK